MTPEFAAHLLDAAGLRVHRASEAADVHARLALALRSAVQNVTSLAGVGALIHKRDKIVARDVVDVRNHFAPLGTTSFPEQAGGSPTGLPSDYFGVTHTSYSPAHAGAGVAAAAVDFAAGIARAAHGVQAGGAPAARGGAEPAPITAALRAAVRDQLAQHALSASKNAEADLIAILKDLIGSLIAALIGQGGAVTPKKLEAAIADPDHAAFR